jgi:hypothetical protein
VPIVNRCTPFGVSKSASIAADFSSVEIVGWTRIKKLVSVASFYSIHPTRLPLFCVFDE